MGGFDDRFAQLHRAAFRHKRSVAAGAAGTTVAAVGLALILSGPGERRAVLAQDPPIPGVTETSAPPATVEPTPAAAPTPSTSPPPSPPPTALSPASAPASTASPSASATCGGGAFPDCPDGKPGWFGGLSSCRDATASDVPAAQQELFDGVTATWVLPRSTVSGGQRLDGKVRLSSSRQDRVVFDVPTGPEFDARVAGGAVHSGDVVAYVHVDLSPGQTQTLDLAVGTTSCADTADEPEPPLAPGSYAAGKGFAFEKAAAVVGSSQTATPGPLAIGSPTAEPTPTDGSVPERGSFAVRLQLTIT